MEKADGALPLWLVTEAGLKTWLGKQSTEVANWVEATGFDGKPGRLVTLPTRNGKLLGAVAGVPRRPDLWSFAHLANGLREGAWQLRTTLKPDMATQAALGFALGTYAFTRYRAPPRDSDRKPASLVWPRGADRKLVDRLAQATFLVRDLVNTPAADLGPAELAQAVRAAGAKFGAEVRVIEGDALLKANWPLVHAVGRASSRPPCLIDLVWGDADAPKVTLVGKGVVFDSGGLDIKPSSGMLTMKKDMGGGATMLGLAQAVMSAGLKVRLRLLIPAVENAVSGNAFRPLDVVKSRAGITVEIGNTDAEGRLILADALAEAVREQPDLLIDAATLTGAARVALGPDLPALFSNDDALAEAILRHGREQSDPLWRLPLHGGYREMLNSRTADISNSGEGGFAGAITAALFLREFAGKAKSWAHIDLYAWNQKPRPGRPPGGEAMALRALYALLAERFG